MVLFTKYEGAGNDFLLIDDRSASFQADIRHLCHRKFGVGADGVILLQQGAISADFRMRIFNPDGLEAESCGNGLRCLGRFLLDLGFLPKTYRIAIHDRIVEISYPDGQVAVQMGEPKNLQLHIATERGTVHFVDTGVPHLVHFGVGSLEELGPYWRHHPHFAPKGTNVNLAQIKEDCIAVRTFERGVEGETLACGTGACAVAVIAVKLHGAKSPVKIVFLGGTLEIHYENDQLLMVGPAIKIFEGKL